MIRHKQCVNFIFIVFKTLKLRSKLETLYPESCNQYPKSFMDIIVIDETMFCPKVLLNTLWASVVTFLDKTYTPLFSQYENFLFCSVYMNKMNV